MTRNPSDLTADLLSDLQGAAAARPLPSSPPPLPVDDSAGPTPPTPTVEVRFTPMRWSLPKVVPVDRGLGVGMAVGPLRVSLSFG